MQDLAVWTRGVLEAAAATAGRGMAPGGAQYRQGELVLAAL